VAKQILAGKAIRRPGKINKNGVKLPVEVGLIVYKDLNKKLLIVDFQYYNKAD
jgi:hypothetical protein